MGGYPYPASGANSGWRRDAHQLPHLDHRLPDEQGRLRPARERAGAAWSDAGRHGPERRRRRLQLLRGAPERRGQGGGGARHGEVAEAAAAGAHRRAHGVHGGPKEGRAGGTIRPRRRFHAAAAVRAAVGDGGRAPRRRLRGLHWPSYGRSRRRHELYPHHPGLRPLLQFLHHPLPPGPAGEPSAARSSARGRAAGGTRCSRGYAAGTDRRRLRTRPARGR